MSSTPARPAAGRATCRDAVGTAGITGLRSPAYPSRVPTDSILTFVDLAPDPLPTRAGFNPRPRAGGDVSAAIVDGRRQLVSIHAPARGATRVGCDRVAASVISFNPRPRTGGDLSVAACSVDAERFQSTPPRGGRRRLGSLDVVAVRCFNPRPRAGGDQPAVQPRCAMRRVSIHAPARGATAIRRVAMSAIASFNPRPRAGGDVSTLAPCIGRCSFNPRPRAGGDDVASRSPAHRRSHGFNPRPRAGGDDAADHG